MTMGGRAKVVVAVDFGTTFSGFAYAKTSEPDNVFKVNAWPGAGRASAKTYCKTQTSLFYAPTSGSDACDFQPLDWGWSGLLSYTEAVRAWAKADAAAKGAVTKFDPYAASTRDSLVERQVLLPNIDYLPSFPKLSLDFGKSSHSDSHSDVLVLPPEITQKVGFFATKFKLLLAPDAHRTSSLPEFPAGLTAERMVEDYLRSLKVFIMSELQVNCGKHVSIEDVQWCLTVPAIWGERSKQVMRVCAEKAGMVQDSSGQGSTAGSPFPVSIILEPEAASVYCQHKCKDLKLKQGDKLLVADVGGGTIDLVVHEKADNDPESMRVHEVVSSYGDLGGGTYVDADFFKYLGQKIGCFEDFSRTNKSAVLYINQWWQGVKEGFNGGDYSAQLDLPKNLREEWEKYELGRQIHRDDDNYYDELRLEGWEIKAIFDTEVQKVIDLIWKQVEGIRVLMVVGGFSASPYLRDRIKRAFETRVEEIIIPENPGSAICHGALQLQLKKDIIQSRIAKRTYGICHERKFKAGDPADLLYKSEDGVWKCRSCIDVFVRVGERVLPEASITRSYYPSYRNQEKLRIELVSSVNESPKYVSEEGVVKEGMFFVDMSRDMHLDRDRRVDATMVFGASLIVVSAERTNFGQPGQVSGLWVTFLAD